MSNKMDNGSIQKSSTEANEEAEFPQTLLFKKYYKLHRWGEFAERLDRKKCFKKKKDIS